MKNTPMLMLAALVTGWIVSPVSAQSPDDRIIIPPRPMPPLPPPRVEVPDVGPMETREMSIRARVDGLHAVVETTMVFHNPNARELEGELVFPLPDGAAVCGYALDINGVLVDGVIVPEQKARVAFENETRRQVDPGLVEHVKGNVYRTRIYPLPAQGERRIRLTYTTSLVMAPNGDAALALPLPRERIASLDVVIEVAAVDGARPQVGGLGEADFEKAEQVWRVESSRDKVTPGEDVLVAMPELPATFHRLEQAGEDDAWFMVSAMAPEVKARTGELDRVHVLWDASGSRSGADLSGELALLRATKASVYQLTVFRNVTGETREFDSAEALVAAIEAEPFDGGTDLEALALALNGSGEANDRTLLFSDGLDTLSGQVAAFGELTPMAVVSQTVADRESLRQACGGMLIDLQNLDVAAALAEIRNPSARVAGVEGTSIADVQGIGRPAKGRVHLLGRLTGPEATVRIRFADGSLSEAFLLRCDEAVAGDVLAKAWASARVNQLTPRAEEFEDELLQLGRDHGLVSPATSLIVLETLEQWVRHEIEPPASLPEMRRQWRAAMKGRGTGDGGESRIERVVTLWQQRVKWWETDFSKQTEAVPQSDRDAAAGELSGAAFGGALRLENGRGGADSAPADAFAAPSAPDGVAGVVPQSLASPLADSAPSGPKNESGEGPEVSSITIKEWDPDTPYLKAIRSAGKGGRYEAYLAQREEWSSSPAFFLDCAGLFLREEKTELGRRILTNLAELRIEDPGLLRVLAWRFQQLGELDRAEVILQRVTRLRPEEPQSFRDLALALTERGRAGRSAEDIEEALDLYLKVALGDWNRHGDSIALFALEEMNALIAWVGRQKWKADDAPEIPEFDERLSANLDTDLRIVMSWDADATDIDLHVMEPGGEEAYYGHNRTNRGGLVSDDITDGYGPEEYLIRIAPTGTYGISARYYGSAQQTVIGPATVTATIYTNWGRANEERRTLTLRLDKPEDKVKIGEVEFGRGELEDEAGNLLPGMSRGQVLKVLGEPDRQEGKVMEYADGSKTIRVVFDRSDKLVRVVEVLPGGAETVIVQ